MSYSLNSRGASIRCNSFKDKIEEKEGLIEASRPFLSMESALSKSASVINTV